MLVAPAACQRPARTPTVVYEQQSGLMPLENVATDGKTVFWTDRDGRLFALSLDAMNAAPKVLATLPGPVSVVHLAGDDVWVGIHDTRDTSALMRVPRGGGEPVPVDKVRVVDIVSDETAVYYAAEDQIHRVARAGGEPTVLTGKALGRGSGGLVLDATHVYFSDPAFGRLLRVAKAGGPVETLFDGHGTRSPSLIAADATGVTFSDGRDILHLASTGGTPKVVVPGLDGAFAQRGDEFYFMVSTKPAGTEVWKQSPRGRVLLVESELRLNECALGGERVVCVSGIRTVHTVQASRILAFAP